MATLVDYDSAIYAIASACDNATWNYRGRSWESKAIAIKALEAEGKDSKELVRVTNPEPWDKVKYTLEKYTDDFINSLEDMFDVTILVSGDKGNFRYGIATIFPYKANRIQELPHHFHAIKDYVVENYEAKRVYHVEVDDALGILQQEGDTLVHIDKDLDQFPGSHYNPSTKKKYEVTKREGLINLYSQLLMGDPTDNIVGIYGVGKSSAYLKKLKEMETEGEMFELARELYYSRYGSYFPTFMLENMRLVYLIQKHIPLVIHNLMDDYSFYTQNWKEKIFIKDE